MALKSLHISNLRNIANTELLFDPHINVICGPNGSGKTSILEAINMLSTGKSFRSHLKSRIIQYSQDKLTLFTQLQSDQLVIPIGLEKSLADDTQLRVSGEDADSISALARILPVQLLHPHSYELLEGGSKPRRQFIDWGVFHVEHLFYELWNNVQRIIKQRNAAIKSQFSAQEIQVWDKELISLALMLDDMRSDYLNQLIPLFHEKLAQITDIDAISTVYYPGWNRELGFEAHLTERIYQDMALGYTHPGPHRADLKLTINKVPVQDALSRGQQKLLVFALRFAQAELYQQTSGKNVLFLIDDLPSELDMQHQQKVFTLIETMTDKAQFFLTGIDQNSFQQFKQARMFHVEHGSVIVAAEPV